MKSKKQRAYAKRSTNPEALDTCDVARVGSPFIAFSLYPLVSYPGKWLSNTLYICRMRWSRSFWKIKSGGLSFVAFYVFVLLDSKMKGTPPSPEHKDAILYVDTMDEPMRVKVTQWTWFHSLIDTFYFYFCLERVG